MPKQGNVRLSLRSIKHIVVLVRNSSNTLFYSRIQTCLLCCFEHIWYYCLLFFYLQSKVWILRDKSLKRLVGTFVSGRKILQFDLSSGELTHFESNSICAGFMSISLHYKIVAQLDSHFYVYMRGEATNGNSRSFSCKSSKRVK